METELSRKIGHRFFDSCAVSRLSISVFPFEITAKSLVHFLEVAQETLVLGHIEKARLRAQLKHPDGVVIGPIPQFGIEVTEDSPGGRLPGPPEVEDYFPERLELSREGGDHVISLKGRHGECAANSEA